MSEPDKTFYRNLFISEVLHRNLFIFDDDKFLVPNPFRGQNCDEKVINDFKLKYPVYYNILHG